jgi:hypothetical protein
MKLNKFMMKVVNPLINKDQLLQIDKFIKS